MYSFLLPFTRSFFLSLSFCESLETKNVHREFSREFIFIVLYFYKREKYYWTRAYEIRRELIENENRPVMREKSVIILVCHHLNWYLHNLLMIYFPGNSCIFALHFRRVRIFYFQLCISSCDWNEMQWNGNSPRCVANGMNIMGEKCIGAALNFISNVWKTHFEWLRR